jgi:hypothetical protein
MFLVDHHQQVQQDSRVIMIHSLARDVMYLMEDHHHQLKKIQIQVKIHLLVLEDMFLMVMMVVVINHRDHCLLHNHLL